MSTVITTLQAPIAFIDGIGGLELVLVMVVVLILFGGQGLPNAARTLGRTLRELKKATGGIEDEIKRVMHDDPVPSTRAKPPAKPPAPAADPVSRASDDTPPKAAAPDSPPPAKE